MGLTMRERHAVIRELAKRFNKASKQERTQILTEAVQLTGYNRSYASFVLRHCGTSIARVVDGQRVVFVPGQAKERGSPRKRKSSYGSKELAAILTRLWALSDGLCGKRLVMFIRATLPILESQSSLSIADPEIRRQLQTISAATIDRILAKTKVRIKAKGRSYTRPGLLLKHHIPIRTFSDWNDQRPGFCELDLVAHDGGSAYGEFMQTLTLTDVATAWTEARALKNKAQCHVFDALQRLRAELPFPLLGIDSDNGSEFINSELHRYCQQEGIIFTRSRPYRKNDNCFVEQKNYSVVRRTVGYYRYDHPQQLQLMEKLYSLLRTYTNFFLPVMRLKEKTRVGSKVTRRYDTAVSPYQRLLDHPDVASEHKEALSLQFKQIKLLSLKQEIDQLQDQLFRSALALSHPPKPPRPGHPPPSHPWRHTNYGIEQFISRKGLKA